MTGGKFGGFGFPFRAIESDWILMNDAFAITKEQLQLTHDETNTLLIEALKADKIKSKGDPVYLGDGQTIAGYKNIHFNTDTWLGWLAMEMQSRIRQ